MALSAEKKLEVNAAVGGWFPGPAPAALRERTDASHVLGWLKNQVHRGSTVPAANKLGSRLRLVRRPADCWRR